MRIRTAITAGALGAVALLGSTTGTAAANDGPHSKSPGSVNIGLNVCGNPLLIPVLSPPVQNYCKNKF
ncbi:chaplin [Streptomyces sp. CA-250714]|uniref:chaplin n=1 Tax=Streptomyces sp. CA-250714 TaxID=3240060 RepID=UPI003D93314C